MGALAMGALAIKLGRVRVNRGLHCPRRGNEKKKGKGLREGDPEGISICLGLNNRRTTQLWRRGQCRGKSSQQSSCPVSRMLSHAVACWRKGLIVEEKDGMARKINKRKDLSCGMSCSVNRHEVT